MLARDIYRDFYDDPGPTTGERIALAGKRIGIALAGCALVLGVLDFAGVHSIPGTDSFFKSARMKIAGLGNDATTPQAISPTPNDAVRVTIPKIPKIPKVPKVAQKQPAAEPSPVDAVAAAGHKDAIRMAMTSPTLTVPALLAPAPRQTSTAPGTSAAASTSAAKTPTPAPSTPQAAASTQAAAQPAVQVPVKQPAQPALAVSDTAAKSHASVAPAQIQLASLPASDVKQDPAALAAPVVAAAPITIPLSDVPLPRAAPPMSPVERLGLTGKEYARAERCLANAIYFEARSEPIRGQMAVAQVVINRVFSPFYPNDVCGVVYQNAHRHLSCQFTFACDGKSKAITDRRHWAVASKIARQTLDGQIYLPEVGKSTHYHAAYVRPNWVREMRKLARHGLHSFYRPYAWGNGGDEPVWGTSRVHKTAAR